MAAELTNFRQGDTKIIEITDNTTGFDVTGYTHWLTLREEFGSPAFIAQVKSLAGAHPDDDIPNNIVYLQLESDVSFSIPVGSYYWDIQRSDGSVPPVIRTLLPSENKLKDKIKVLEQVTKDA